MKKLVMTAVAACVSMAVTAAYAETTTKQDPIRLAQADKAADKSSKKSMAKEPTSVPDSGDTSGKARTPSGKQRKSGPDAKGVDDNSTSPGPSGQKGRTPSGKERKAGPDAKNVDDASGAGDKAASKKTK